MWQAHSMIRTIGLIGMAGGFLVISPPMRDAALQAGLSMGACLEKYSPYSYVALSATILSVLILLARSVAVKR